jgi:hypothetical protein
VGNPLAALCYAISLMYCTPVGLGGGGANQLPTRVRDGDLRGWMTLS